MKNQLRIVYDDASFAPETHGCLGENSSCVAVFAGHLVISKLLILSYWLFVLLLHLLGQVNLVKKIC